MAKALGLAGVIIIVLIGGYFVWAWSAPAWPFEPEVGLPTMSESPTPDPTAGWKEYTDGRYGFSVRYPADFGVTSTWEESNKVIIKKLSEPVGLGTSAEAITFWVATPGGEPEGTREVPGEIGGDFLRTVVPLGDVDLVIDRAPMPALEDIVSTLRLTEPGPVTEWKRFSSEYFTLSGEIPSHWKVEEGPDSILLSPLGMQGESPVNQPSVSIVRYTDSFTRDSAMQDFRRRLSQVKETKISIDGHAFTRLDGVFEPSLMHAANVYFDKSVLSAHFNESASGGPETGIIEHIIWSLKFSK